MKKDLMLIVKSLLFVAMVCATNANNLAIENDSLSNIKVKGNDTNDEVGDLGYHHMHGRFSPNIGIDSLCDPVESTTVGKIPTESTSVGTTVTMMKDTTNSLHMKLISMPTSKLGINPVAPNAPYGGAGGPFGLTNIGIPGSNLDTDPSLPFIIPGLPDYIGKLMSERPVTKTQNIHQNCKVSTSSTKSTVISYSGSPYMMGILDFIVPSPFDNNNFKVNSVSRSTVDQESSKNAPQTTKSVEVSPKTQELDSSMWSIF